MAEKRLWKSAATSSQAMIRMVAGSLQLSAGTQLKGFMEISGGGSKWAICAERVHAGVGAAGAVESHRLFRDLRQRGWTMSCTVLPQTCDCQPL